ncbi:M48 family metallopeptidase [Mesonia sp. K7]|uniref:M48 family metallopeptidase n=1 Tax=Mesonia sp. K7 TaxID=2218606 RepID=UPI000DA9976A|nr:M48 family metallopeptidase [Mesonia sp. K7]PZD79458.1 M48 family peptidase [Mesonia sp. K7]
MTPEILFYILISIIIFNFIWDTFLDVLNAKRFGDKLPAQLQDVYEKEAYEKSQAYKKEKFRFGLLSSTFSLILTVAFFFFDGFAFVDELARNFSENEIIVALLFFGMIMLASDILTTPFAYYNTFVIEEKYGFNKTIRKTFFLDKIKGWLLGAVLGGLILAVIIWFYQTTGENFWIYAWLIITVFSVFINMFYSKLIVPLFNKQTPLEDGSLRDKIETYASKIGFKLENIFIIDGSKRSTKANAYFSGFGKQKRITLFDTLVNDLEEEEIVAVLAHEVGHYKKRHIIYNLATSVILTGFTLWLLSLFINNPIFAEALNVTQPSFHIGLIVFGILYSPISEITGLFSNLLSRKFEYQADDYAKKTHQKDMLISSLKKLSSNSFSNLTPHAWYVFFHYSHPTLLQRIKNLEN